MDTNKLTREYKIYVACLASYNNGILYGKWIDLIGKTSDEIKKEISEMLKGSSENLAEEWGIHDHSFSFHVSDNHDIDELVNYVDLINSTNFDEKIIVNVMNFLNVKVCESINYIEENFLGIFNDLESWAEDFLDQTDSLSEIPKHLRYYIDFASYARDCELNGDIFTIENSEGLYVFSNR